MMYIRIKLKLAALLAAALLAGCAGYQQHSEGLALLEAGRMQEGLGKLDEAARAAPDNVSYRTDLARYRERTVNKLLAGADSERAAGRGSSALVLYERALALQPGNNRAEMGIELLRMDERHAAAIQQAEALLNNRDTEAALAALRPVLAENPRNADAVGLQRRINDQVSKQAAAEPQLKASFTKPVTLQFRDANLKMVFEALSRTSGINVLMDRDVKPDLKTSIFVKEVSVEDTINLILMQNQLEKKVISDNTVFIYPATPAKLKEYQDLKIRSFHLTNADPKQILTMIKTLLKTKDIFVHEKTNSLVMRDTPDAIRLAEKIVADQDIDQAEVMLEVEVLEVGTARLSELGIRWPNSFGVATPDSITTLGQLRDLKSSALLVTPLSATLNLQLEDGNTNVLASPRIRVRNREKAKIMIGSRVPVITNAVTPVSTGTPVVTGNVQYLDVGLKLDVEPDIHLDNEVVIKVALDVSSIIKEVQNAQSGTLAYEIGTRNAATVLRLKDGETQVLAGLISDEERHTASKVPGLGQLPVIGRLFSSHRENGTKTEIVLSITPRVVGTGRPLASSPTEYWAGTESNLRNGTLNVNSRGTIAMSSTTSGTVAPPAARPGSTARPGAAPSAAAGPATPAPANPITFSWQGPSDVKPGDRVDLTLEVKSPQAMNRLDLVVGFNPQVLKAVDVSEGGFLQQGGTPMVMTRNIEPASGEIQLQMSGRGSEGPSGAGSLVTVTFEAIAPAPSAPVTVSRVAAGGLAGETLPATAPEPYSIKVTP